MNLLKRITSLFHTGTHDPVDHIGYGVLQYTLETIDDDGDYTLDTVQITGHLFRDRGMVTVLDQDDLRVSVPDDNIDCIICGDDEEHLRDVAMDAELQRMAGGDTD